MEHVRVSRCFTFDGAHFLPGYEGKCSRLHGHTWKVEVTFEGVVSKESGMVIDFLILDKVVGKYVSVLDHHLLNDTLEMPTAENIVLWLRDRIQREAGLPMLVGVKVWESPDSCAEWREV